MVNKNHHKVSDLFHADKQQPRHGGMDGNGALAVHLHLIHEAVLVLDGATGAVISIDGENRHAMLTGIKGQGLANLVDADCADSVRQAMAHCTASSQPTELVFSVTNAGHKRYFQGPLLRLDGSRLVCVARDNTIQQLNQHALGVRAGADKLIGQLSSRFINSPPEGIAGALAGALAELGSHANVDRVHLFTRSHAEQACMHCTQAWRRTASMTSPLGLTLRDQSIPWLLEKLQNNGLVCLDHRNDLPPEAGREHALLSRQAIDAMAVAPIIYSGALQGWLGFDRNQGEHLWDSSQLHLLRAAARIFANALQRQESEQRIHQLAHYDPVTGLPNRMLLQRRLEEQITLHPDAPFSLILIDMDDAGLMFDLMGHDAGDAMLRGIAARLATCLPEDTRHGGSNLARWGADEFMFCLPGQTAGDGLEQALAPIRRALSAPLAMDGQSLKVSFSMSAVHYPADTRDAPSLLRFAELALRHGRRECLGKLQSYHPGLESRAAARNRLLQRLRHAMENDGFHLHYQPLLDTSSLNLVGVEALLRWNDPELGEVSPEMFVPLAEDSGLIIALGGWVLTQACEQLMHWRRAGVNVPRIAVNVSGHQLLDNHLPDLLKSLLARHALPASAIEIEVTESTLLERDMRSRPALRQLRELGAGIAVDDFGTGYSSLSKLKHLQVNVLKIDRSFIQDIFTDEHDRAIVIAVLAMARQLGVSVVAEGVETPGQLEFLRQHGCDVVQGFLHSTPMPATALQRWLKARH